MNESLNLLRARLGAAAFALLLTAIGTAALCPGVAAQLPAPGQTAAVPAVASQAPEPDPKAGGITEDELKQMLVGKTFYLRAGYLDNTLSFDEHGKLASHSPLGSYTLCLIQVDKVRLSKHKVELTGLRYGLHFLGALPNEDPTTAMDKVRITPKKKAVRITVDRELVVKPKKKKARKGDKGDAASKTAAPGANKSDEAAAVDEARAEMAAAPETEQPADSRSVTTTTSPAHATKLLKNALDTIFAPSLDARMIDAMPAFWKLYYQAAAAQTDFAPSDPSVRRQNQVDRQAKLLSTLEAPSNEYAQAGGVAGMALYHAVIGADGKPQEIVVGRPIGFGLDESAADTIRKASFQPALKDGKSVAVVLDLVVQFRIYSNRTNRTVKDEAEEAKSVPKLPGPYSVSQP